MSGQSKNRGRTDRELVIEWLKSDLKYYKENVDGVTEFGTPITQKLIDAVQNRITQLINNL